MTNKIQGIKRRMISGIFLTLALGGGIFFMVRGCAGNISPDVANLALKTEGKTYVYSQLGSTIVKKSIKENKSPNAMAFVQVFKDNDEFFVAPGMMKEVAHLFAGNYETHAYEEKKLSGVCDKWNE